MFSTFVLRKIKTRHTLKKDLVVYGAGHGTKLDEFSERLQPPPSPLRMVPISGNHVHTCMRFILFVHHTSSHICNHIYHKKFAMRFYRNEGGSKAVWNFSGNSSDLVG